MATERVREELLVMETYAMPLIVQITLITMIPTHALVQETIIIP